MSWNHRILAHEKDGDVFFQVHEVYYDGGVPNGYSEVPCSIGGESLEEIEWSVDRVRESLSKPILCAGDRFPIEYKI